jgi:hypothetical protein
MESSKFDSENKVYFDFIEWVNKNEISSTELIYEFTSWVGQVNLMRFLSFAETYKKTLELSGDIADIGTYKGSSMFAFAKLIKTFEPYSQTVVHSFDWFKGMRVGSKDDQRQSGKYLADYRQINEMRIRQGLDGITNIHNLDLTQDLASFFESRPWLRFKLVLLDVGIEAVIRNSMKFFWPRLVPGGILMLDHFNNESSPMESVVIEEYIGSSQIKQYSYSRSPSAYIVKK